MLQLLQRKRKSKDRYDFLLYHNITRGCGMLNTSIDAVLHNYAKHGLACLATEKLIDEIANWKILYEFESKKEIVAEFPEYFI